MIKTNIICTISEKHWKKLAYLHANAYFHSLMASKGLPNNPEPMENTKKFFRYLAYTYNFPVLGVSIKYNGDVVKDGFNE
jgi:hypothetical protein